MQWIGLLSLPFLILKDYIYSIKVKTYKIRPKFLEICAGYFLQYFIFFSLSITYLKGFSEDLIPFSSYFNGLAEDLIHICSYLKGFSEDLIPFTSYFNGLAEDLIHICLYFLDFSKNKFIL